MGGGERGGARKEEGRRRLDPGSIFPGRGSTAQWRLLCFSRTLASSSAETLLQVIMTVPEQPRLSRVEQVSGKRVPISLEDPEWSGGSLRIGVHPEKWVTDLRQTSPKAFTQTERIDVPLGGGGGARL